MLGIRKVCLNKKTDGAGKKLGGNEEGQEAKKDGHKKIKIQNKNPFKRI